jgi:hypothetical protein
MLRLLNEIKGGCESNCLGCGDVIELRSLRPKHCGRRQLKKLVNDAFALHRDIVAQTERLKIMKAELVREARLPNLILI